MTRVLAHRRGRRESIMRSGAAVQRQQGSVVQAEGRGNRLEAGQDGWRGPGGAEAGVMILRTYGLLTF